MNNNNMYWGTAVVSRDRQGIATSFSAVRFQKNITGYKTEADIYGNEKVDKCLNRSQAVIRAVNVAMLEKCAIDKNTAERYSQALENERKRLADIAKKALEKATEKHNNAVLAVENAKTDATGTLSNITIV